MKNAMSKTTSLRVCTWNVCLGIKYKLKQVEEVLKKNKIDIICLQEVELTSEDDLSIVELEGYTKEVERGEGKRRSMLYIKNTIHYERHEDKEKPNTHVILVSIKENNKIVQLASIYRTYKLTTRNTHKEEFADQLEVIKNFFSNGKSSILLGDLNLDYNKKGHLNYNNHALSTLLDEFENECHLTQLVKFDTWRRVIRGELKTSLLDHVYESECGLVENIEEVSSSMSDHTPLLMTLALRTNGFSETIVVRNWSSYTPEKLQEMLREECWDIDCHGVQDFSNELEQKLMLILESLIPFEEKKIRNNNYTEPQWLSEMKRKRKNLFKNARRRKSANLFLRCKQMDRKIRSEEQKISNKRIRNTILKGGQKGLWDGVKLAQNKPYSQIPREMSCGEESFEKDEEIAQGFADYFINKVNNIANSAGVRESVFNGSKKVDVASENSFTEENVLRAMKNLKNKSSYGFDNIPVKVLRDGCDILVKPYHRLLNKIYHQSSIPEQWKTSRILPLHKKGQKKQMENYRPISNLCAGSKIFERLILQRILEIDNQTEFSLTGENQHGFKKGKSTITASADIQSRIASLMDEDQYVAMASLDLSAAFDVINIDLLLRRLEIMGMPEDLMSLLRTWLRDRLCYVEVRNNCSQFYSSNCGTVQGSILGPVLFNLFLSPLLEKEDMTSYADDSYLIKANKTKEVALRRLQFQCKKVEKWMTGSGLKVNIGKTELVIFHRMDATVGTIQLNGFEIVSKKEMSVLGVMFDSKLEWSTQVEKASRKARSTLQGLRVIDKYFTIPEKLTLLTTFFYSRLYYGSQIWLIPSLKRVLKTKLFSASGNALKLLERGTSFRDLHKKYNRATPTQFQKYTTAVSFYDLVKTETPENDWINIQFNIQNDRRNPRLTFQTNNRYKCGLNCLSNRFKSITNEIDKEWIEQTRDSYKTKCKKRLITDKLLKL